MYLYSGNFHKYLLPLVLLICSIDAPLLVVTEPTNFLIISTKKTAFPKKILILSIYSQRRKSCSLFCISYRHVALNFLKIKKFKPQKCFF